MHLLEHAQATGGATVFPAPIANGSGPGLSVSAPAVATEAGVVFSFEGKARDWSHGSALVFHLRANGAHRLRLHFTHGRGTWTLFLIPRPGLLSRVVLPFTDLLSRPRNSSHPGYSRYGGGPQPMDLADVRSLTVTFNQVSPEDKTVDLSEMTVAIGDVPASVVLNPSVVVDEWGQWTGERGLPRTGEQLHEAWRNEPRQFSRFPGHTDTGANARLKVADGTGYFAVAETENRFYLADPDGYAFFSIGCDCVGPYSSGPVSGREFLFADLSHAAASGGRRPADGSLWADFYQQNLIRRYANEPNVIEEWQNHTVARLRSWGFNTIGNWSDAALTRRGLLPYTTNIGALAPLCAHLPDVFAPDFADRVRALVTPEVTPFLSDRMLVGYFVGNEPEWTFGGSRHPFNDVWTLPEYPHTRERALAFTREMFGSDLSALNAAWQAAAKTWDDLARPGVVPDVRLGTDALKQAANEFMGSVLAEFYVVCCRAIRAVDPNHLLLGGRFYAPDLADPCLGACKPFDVFSFNRYNWDANPKAIGRIHELTDRPCLIGEFHFGVEDRGLTASLVATHSQTDRGLAYRHFVENAAALPHVVGLHWFQWVDQPVTGRFDGECYNIGLVDITDLPYDDFLTPVRETHARLYDVCRKYVVPYTFPNTRPPAW